MSTTNPLLRMSIYSLTNALELYQSTDQSNEERRRFGALILTDLSAEYILKAKLYQIDPHEFFDKQQELSFSSCMKDNRIIFIEGEKSNLWKAHEARNLSQHRGSITDSLFSQEYLQWFCKFINRFAKENFNCIISQELPVEFRFTWSKLASNFGKPERNKPVLEEPLYEHYRTVKDWITAKKGKNRRGFLTDDYLLNLNIKLRNYCNSLGMNPNQIIENSLNGSLSPDEDMDSFLKNLSYPISDYSIYKSFYEFNGIKISLPYPKYQRVDSCRALNTNQLRELCDYSDLEEKSWILANSYMGLKVGKLSLLKVKDFRIHLWDTKKNIYPVKIRMEVSNYYDYTTFIGADAKKVLQEYFNEKRLSPEDYPWNYNRHCVFNDSFRRNCQKIGIYEKGRIRPKSLEKRLKTTLRESGMPHEWVCYLFGNAPYNRYTTTSIDAPLDDELSSAYEKAYPKLKVYDEKETRSLAGAF